MLIKINHNQWLNINDVYLVTLDDYKDDELMIYIRPHPKIPIILKGIDNIKKFNQALEFYHLEKIEYKRCVPKNDSRTSEIVLEEFDPPTENGLQ